MPDTDNETPKYTFCLKFSCIIQFCLGILLIICGSLAVSCTHRLIDNHEPLCHASVFAVGVLMIIAGVVSVLIQRKEENFNAQEQGNCLIYTEHGLCALICVMTTAGFFLCTVSALSNVFEDCEQAQSMEACRDRKTRRQITTLTNMFLLLASAFESVLRLCCRCKYGRHFGVDRQCCPTGRSERNSIETEPPLKLTVSQLSS